MSQFSGTGAGLAYDIEERLPRRYTIGWATGGLATALMINTQGLLLLRFMTDYLGIGAVIAASLLAASRFFDAAIDPVFGWLSDRTRSRWGRRAPFLLFGAPLCAAAMVMMFDVPAFLSPAATIAYVGFALIVFAAAYTVFRIPHLAMSAEITLNTRSRADLMFYKVYATAIGGVLIAQTALPKLLTFWGGTREAHGAIGWVAGAVVLIAGLVTFWSTRNAHFTSPRHDPPMAWRQKLKLGYQNKPFMTLLYIKLAYLFAFGMYASSLPFFSKYVMLKPDAWLGTIFVTGSIAMFATQPAWVWLVRRYDKRVSLVLAFGLFAIGMGSWWFAAPDDGWAGIIARACIYGIGQGGVLLIIQIMLPDTIEYDRNRTGLHREGIYAALFTMVEKGMSGLGTAFLGAFLGMMGYVASTKGIAADQPESAIFALRLAVAVFPASALVIAMLLSLRYDLSAARLIDSRAIRAA